MKTDETMTTIVRKMLIIHQMKILSVEEIYKKKDCLKDRTN